jgi:hypothetical protein
VEPALPAAATYCDRDVEGRNGNEIFGVPRQDNDKPAARCTRSGPPGAA